jgi:hypothetical protein
MMWHVITRVGAEDTYDPVLDAKVPRMEVDLRRPGAPYSLGPDVIWKFTKDTGRLPSDAVCDFLTVAMAAYAADLRIPRETSDDQWTREMTLHVPVVDGELWANARRQLQQLLDFLTGDRWTLAFRARAPVPIPSVPQPTNLAIQSVCLFSGGLDSLVGAIDLLSSGEPVALVGQYGAGSTNAIQERVLAPLRQAFGKAIHEHRFYVQPPKDGEDGELTQRSRSILFLALGVMVASTYNAQLVVAENGPISLNVPLTYARMGSLSTRTTHPHVIAELAKFLNALGIGVTVTFPYRCHTKGEMLAKTKNPGLLGTIAPLTVSCSHPDGGRYQGYSPGTHCGYCVPCIIRRASLNAAGMPQDAYWGDSSPHPNATDAARDLTAFQIAIERLRGARPRTFISAVTSTGPLPAGDIEELASVYRRGMSEVAVLLGLPPIL